MSAGARAEWGVLREVLVHRPGIEAFFGLLDPYAFLYERAFSLEEARKEHARLEAALTAGGVTVRHLSGLAHRLEANEPELRARVLDLVPRIVRYAGPRPVVARSRRALVESLSAYDAETLFDILLLRPSIDLRPRSGARAFLPTVTLDGPLANLYFLRDQQALTANGYVLGRMAKPQRRREPLLTGGLLRAIGAPIVGEIGRPGTFEGGDFLPMDEFALLGEGDRTNRSGVRQFLALDHGFDEVGVVHQPRHPAVPSDEPDPMINMHLDTYLNVLGERLAVGCAPLLREARVEVYRRRGGGRPEREPRTVSLEEYLTGHRIEILPISTLEQMCYATNLLCLGDRAIVAVDVEAEVERVLGALERSARRNPRRYAPLLRLACRELEAHRSGDGFFPRATPVQERGVRATIVGLRNITGGYGGAHCMTCVVRRDDP